MGTAGLVAYQGAKWVVMGFSDVRVVAARLRSLSGREPGDPTRAAGVIVGLSEMSEPPTRLVLGSDAVGHARETARTLAASDAAWRHLSESIDFPAS
jgi:hypothetical protein